MKLVDMGEKVVSVQDLHAQLKENLLQLSQKEDSASPRVSPKLGRNASKGMLGARTLPQKSPKRKDPTVTDVPKRSNHGAYKYISPYELSHVTSVAEREPGHFPEA